jgi:hypothetical protein
VSPAVLTKAPLVKQGQRRNPVLATPRAKMRSVLRLILPGGELPLQSSQKTKHAKSKTPKATKGQILTIRSRIPTGIHAATTSVAQIEFAASQSRQEVTKLNENEVDAATEIRLCTGLGKKPLKFRLLLIVVFMLLNESASRSRQPRSQAST